jgi:SH3-like domain-containing protein
MPRLVRAITVAALAIAALPQSLPSTAKAANAPDKGSGLPVPRFVSLKSDSVNVRRGPGQEYAVAFTFVRAGLPVEITQEFDTWRKIRDSDGSEGWVFHSLLSGKRTGLVTPWLKSGQVPTRRSPDASAAVTAYLEPHVMVVIQQCNRAWCDVSGEGFAGWIEQDKLWGVYPDERVGG